MQHKQILLGVTGGIAAYKSADLARRLREAGAEVRVVMTEHAKQFITPLTMQAVSGNPVHDQLFDVEAEAAMGHIQLARWADLIVVAPATADFMARFSHGEANDLLTTLCLATKAPIALVPAMNQIMWKNKTTQENLQALQKKDIKILGPAEGNQACGDHGLGRMLEPAEIVTHITALFNTGLLAGKNVLVTAGPTREAIDPIRFISNGSSGKMGYALASAAVEAGAHVTLISGPVHLPKPSHLKCIDVMSAEQMFAAVMKEIENCDIFLSVAAVGDYYCKNIASQKIHKQNVILNLTLERTPDIISAVTQLTKKPFTIGFAAETENVLQNAKEKRIRKKLDMIIANEISEKNEMGSDENAVTVLWGNEERAFEKMPKRKLARELITLISTLT